MPKLKDVPAWGWLALAAALRIVFALKLGGRFYQSDEVAFEQSAWNLASTGTLGLAVLNAPVPRAFFALFYLFGRRMVLPRLGQALVSAATAGAIGGMTEDLSGSRAAGRGALAVGSVYPFFVYYSGMLLSETLYLAFIVLGFWALCRSLRERGAGAATAGLAGALLGVAGLCRAEAVPIALLLWIALAGLCAARRYPWKSLSLAALLWAAPLAAWTVRNQSLTGHYVLDNHGGFNLLLGTEYFDLNEKDTGLARQTLEASPFFAEGRTLSETEQDQRFTRRAFEFMRGHPAETARQWASKLLGFWRFYPRVEKTYLENSVSRPSAGLGRPVLVLISLLFEPWIILGGLIGFWTLRDRWETLFPLAWFVLGTMGVHMVSVSQMRYRLPVMPFLIFAALAAYHSRPATVA